MRFWRSFLGGLLLWAANFFALYAIGSAWPGTDTARLLIVLVTLLTLGLAAWLSAKAYRTARTAPDDLLRWLQRLALLAYALAGTAAIYQGLPALL